MAPRLRSKCALVLGFTTQLPFIVCGLVGGPLRVREDRTIMQSGSLLKSSQKKKTSLNQVFVQLVSWGVTVTLYIITVWFHIFIRTRTPTAIVELMTC